MSEIIKDLLPSGHTDLSVIDRDIMAVYGLIKASWPDVYVNANGDQRIHNYCGWRPQDCKVGAAKSAHKLGKALDLHSRHLRELRAWIINVNETLKITRMEAEEATPGWLHIDIMPLTDAQIAKIGKGNIYVFKP